MISLRVNGNTHQVDVPEDTPLLWVLREQLGLTGTKYSCGIAECGNCGVLIDDEVQLSCVTLAVDVQGKEITTIEGLNDPLGKTLKEAWKKEDVAQCGYCQPGQLVAAAAMLRRNPSPDDTEVSEAMSGVLCRCGTYQSIYSAIQTTIGELKHDKA